MRCLIIPVLVAMLGAAPAVAEDLNLVGIYTDGDMTSSETAAEPGDLVTIHVVLARPHNPHRDSGRGEPVDNVGCYAFTLDLTENLQLVAKSGAEPARPDCSGVCTNFRVCYGLLLPVGEDERITLRSFVVRYLGPGPGLVRLRPPSLEIVAGQMDYWYRDADHTGWVLPMYPATGDFETPAFVVSPDQVAAVPVPWGRLKALYH